MKKAKLHSARLSKAYINSLTSLSQLVEDIDARKNGRILTNEKTMLQIIRAIVRNSPAEPEQIDHDIVVNASVYGLTPIVGIKNKRLIVVR